MSINQLHGKKYEDYIKQAFKGSLDAQIDYTGPWDVPTIYDSELNLPTSIKTSKGRTIGLSDARRFLKINEPFRLIFSQYVQKDGIKHFKEIREYIITVDVLRQIIGDLTYDFVEFFHNELKKFPEGKENAILARKKAREIKRESTYKSLLKLNPKIDSKDQRRLQCSIDMIDLDKICQPTVYSEIYKGLSTEVFIESTSREFLP
jgi:hypothetical protein